MPRGVYDRQKAKTPGKRKGKQRRAQKAKPIGVAAECDSKSWLNIPSVVADKIDEERDYHVRRLTAERDQFKGWLHEQANAYLDIIDRLVDVQRRFGT